MEGNRVRIPGGGRDGVLIDQHRESGGADIAVIVRECGAPHKLERAEARGPRRPRRIVAQLDVGLDEAPQVHGVCAPENDGRIPSGDRAQQSLEGRYRGAWAYYCVAGFGQHRPTERNKLITEAIAGRPSPLIVAVDDRCSGQCWIRLSCVPRAQLSQPIASIAGAEHETAVVPAAPSPVHRRRRFYHRRVGEFSHGAATHGIRSRLVGPKRNIRIDGDLRRRRGSNRGSPTNHCNGARVDQLVCDSRRPRGAALIIAYRNGERRPDRPRTDAHAAAAVDFEPG